MKLILSLMLLTFTLGVMEGMEWNHQQKKISKGHLSHYKIASSILKNKRDVWVYTPVGYSKKKEAPYSLLIAFDGQAYVSDLIPVPKILDNMIAYGYMPPLVAVFVSSIDQNFRNRELPCDESFIEFLAQELLPWVHQHYNVTDKPERTIVTGSSYGGLAAAYAGLMHPEIFGNILSQSGAFYWNDQWIVHQFEAAPKLPLKFYLDVGDEEGDLLGINRYMGGTLKAKGYPVYYAEFPGGHEYNCWKAAFPIGLLALGEKK